MTKTASLCYAGSPIQNYTLLSTIGLVVAATIVRPGATSNKFVFIDEQHCSQFDLLDALKNATGEEEWTVKHKNSKETAKEGWTLLNKGNVEGANEITKAGVFSSAEGMDCSKDRELAKSLLGLPKPEDLETAVKGIASGEKV